MAKLKPQCQLGGIYVTPFDLLDDDEAAGFNVTMHRYPGVD